MNETRGTVGNSTESAKQPEHKTRKRVLIFSLRIGGQICSTATYCISPSSVQIHLSIYLLTYLTTYLFYLFIQNRSIYPPYFVRDGRILSLKHQNIKKFSIPRQETYFHSTYSIPFLLRGKLILAVLRRCHFTFLGSGFLTCVGFVVLFDGGRILLFCFGF